MFSFLTPFWLKIGAAVIALGAAFGGGFWLEGAIKDRTILTMQRDQANANTISVSLSLKQLQSFIDNMQTASAGYQSDKDALNNKLNALAKDFANAIKAKPLPLDCIPDSVRLHNLSAAVAAANAAAAGHILSGPVHTPQ